MHATQAVQAVLLTLLVLCLLSGVAPRVHAQGEPVQLGPNIEYIGPYLWAMLQRHADGEAVPDFVVVAVSGRTDVEADPPLEEFIKFVGGEEVEKYTWRIQTGHMLAVVKRPDAVGFAQPHELVENKPDRYPTLGETLEDIIAAFEGGITAERAIWYALYVHGASVLVEMQAPDTNEVASIRDWLTGREVYVPPAEDFRAFSDNFLAVLVPLELLAPLAEAFPHTYLSAASSVAEQLLPMDRAHWPPEALEFEEAVVALYLPEGQSPPPAPAPTFTPAPSLTRVPTDTPAPAPTAAPATTQIEESEEVSLDQSRSRQWWMTVAVVGLSVLVVLAVFLIWRVLRRASH